MAKKPKKNKHLPPQYEIYSDGSFRPPYFGAYGAIIVDHRAAEPQETILAYPAWNTTISRMELMAMLVGLESIQIPSVIHVFSDSQYAVNCCSGWIHHWARGGWKLQSGGEVKNRDLLERLRLQIIKHNITFFWVRGHASNEMNNKVDAAVQSLTRKMRDGILISG